MLLRNLLLAIGILCLLAGVALSVIWLNQMRRAPVEAVRPERIRPAVLVAARAIPAGTLLRAEDIDWKEIEPSERRAGQIVRGQVAETEFLGAITRRDFAQGEPFIVSELVKPSDRNFLSAVLRPGMRAVSISVDAPQSASGLVLPGDQVDVILIQSFGEAAADPGHKSVGETVLRDVRVIAVDQSLQTAARVAPPERGLFAAETRIPKTVTLELSEQQAEMLFVAGQLGRLQLAVRPLEGAGAARAAERRERPPTWAADVSSALRELGRRPAQPPSTGSPLESAVRRPPPSY